MLITKYHKKLIRKAEKEEKIFMRSSVDEKTEMIIRAVEKSSFFKEHMSPVRKKIEQLEFLYRFSLENCQWFEKLVDDIVVQTCLAISRDKQIHVVME